MIAETSRAVFTEIVQPTLSDRQQLILSSVKAHPDRTCAEIGDILGLLPHTISGRFGELERKGLIEQSGRRACRVAGNNAYTWHVKGDYQQGLF